MRNKKKYGIAALAAVAVLAMSAFAASLTVNAGTLQAGVDDELTCGENADLSYVTGYNQSPTSDTYNTTEPFNINAITVDFDSDCNGAYAHLKVNNGDHDPSLPHGYGIHEITSSSVTFTIATDSLRVEDLEQVQVMVKSPAVDGETGGYYSGVITGAS